MTRREVINIEEAIKKILPKELIKDLQNDERICPTCHGLGMRVENNVYGIKGDTSEVAKKEHFPYKHQALSFCPDCYNGVQKLCKYCGEPFKQKGYYHCDCIGAKKADEEKRIIKWNETISKAKEVQESEVQTMLYCEEFDKYYDFMDDFFDGYSFEWNNSKDKNIVKPQVLWVCSEERINIRADSVIENACDDLHEDASENCDYGSLQKLLDEWCENQTGTTTYFPYYKQYVKIDWSEY